MKAATDLQTQAGRRLLAALLLFVAAGQFTASNQAAFVRVGEFAQDFTLKNRKSGEQTSLKSFAGKIIFLDLFAYW